MVGITQSLNDVQQFPEGNAVLRAQIA
jgi:hypothetical protein